MEVVLFEPEIPQNAGNVVRTCAVTANRLTLVKPLGFSTSSRHLKRAGLDYWEGVEVNLIDELDTYLKGTSGFYFFSSKATRLYTEIAFKEDDLLIFGSETKGLPEHLWKRWPERFYTLPMIPKARSLNLSNSVAIVIYEAWRQLTFRGAARPFCEESRDLSNRQCV